VTIAKEAVFEIDERLRKQARQGAAVKEGGSMNQASGHLIVVSHRAGQIWQIKFSRAAITILVSACVLSFVITVVAGFTFPPIVSDQQHAKLEAENRALRIETRNLTVKMSRLNGQIGRLEEQSTRIVNHLESD
jgi:hypothetical protein